MSGEQIPSSHDPLDELLSVARFPLPADRSILRLEKTWRELRRPARRIVPVLSAAAAVMLVIGAWALLWREATLQTEMGVATSPPRRHAPDAPAGFSAGRPATTLELALVRVVEVRDREATTLPVRRTADNDREVIEARLALVIAQSNGKVAAGIAEQFCAVATTRSLPLVLKLAQREQTRPATIDALARLADAETLAQWARASQSSDERRRLIAGMISRMSSSEAQAYLELVSRPESRDDALAALKDAKASLADGFFDAIDSPRADLRVAAAMALGRMEQPAVSRRLIEMVAADRSRREAFLALAASREQAARQFMQRAAQSHRFAGQARSALAQVQVQGSNHQYSLQFRS